ncbi:MAG: tRNA (adenine(22)-N(1))-methyltransferase TrmK [Gammaproteobacteria bacterium]|nr:tRNA (adenine(22)-N(1))-methyltransferase TrmK [Gammaproteobacteria bacterium]
MKVSKRIDAISSMVIAHQHRWQHVWDCCCDHGHLGMKILDRIHDKDIHFVDIVPSIMTTLTANLSRIFEMSRWHVHCLDVADLPLEQDDTSTQHLIVIAGVGGEQTMTMIHQILQKFPHHQLEFLLCPLRHQYKLRCELNELQLGLVNEQLIKENKWFYEIIHVSTDALQPISPVGSLMWHQQPTLSIEYLDKTISHYQRMSAHNVTDIINHYREIKDNLIGSPTH